MNTSQDDKYSDNKTTKTGEELIGREVASKKIKALTKSQIASEIAQKNGITKAQAVSILEHLASLAYIHAKDSFTIPGLGKLVLVDRKARIGRNPATGETIQIKAKKVVKFRVAKAAKDAILGMK